MRHVGLLHVAQSPRLAHHGRFEARTHEAAVAESLATRRGGKDLAQSSDRVGNGREVGGVGETGEDLDELIVGVVVELQRQPEAAFQPGVRRDELGHWAGVPGDDDEQLVAVVLHPFHERIDRFAAELVVCECVRLVDEQRAAERLLDHLGGLDRGLTDVAGDEIGAVALDEMAVRQHADGAVDPRDEARDGGLAGTGIADEHEVAGHVGDLETGRNP